MVCTHSTACPLYAVFKMQALLGVWRASYCDTDRHKECARFRLSLEGKSVPPNLLPNGKLLGLPQP